MFIDKIKNCSKRTLAWILVLIMLLSAFISVPVAIFASAEENNVNYLEVKSGAAWTSIIYATESVNLVKNGFYKISFDYKVISGEPVFEVEAYDSTESKYKNISDSTISQSNFYSVEDIVENGITRHVVSFRILKKVTDIKITIGAYTEDNGISCAFANPELYRYKSQFNGLYNDATNQLKDLSEENIYDVMAEDPDHKSNLNEKWNLRYLTGNRNKIVYGTLTESEHKAMFAPPSYMIRFYEGNQNTVAEYLDKDITLDAGKYSFNCDWKESADADFKVAVSNDNGITFTNVNTKITDSENSQRKAEFELEESANAIKITVGNATDKSNVSLAFANPVLTREDSETNLVQTVNSSTINMIGLSDSSVEEKWNIRCDSENKIAVDTIKVPDGYFLDEKESQIYETYSGFPWVRIQYDESSVNLKAGKTYIVSADFKLKGGTMENDKIGITDDPLFRVQVDTVNKMGLSVDTYLSQKHADKFNGLVTEFDEAQGKIIIKFSPKEDMGGVKFIIGNYCESAIGSCAVANPVLYEYRTKDNGVIVKCDTLIKNINEDTVHNPAEGKSANSEVGKWNTVHLNNLNSFKVSGMQDGYFEPEDAYIKTLTGAKNNRVEYIDNTTVFEAGVRYRLKFNYRVYSGEPQAFLSFKQIDGVEGEYAKLDENAKFVDYFNDQVDENAYTRTITFVPSKDISMLKFVVGNTTDSTEVSVSIANAELCVVDEYDLAIGENLITKINRPNIKRNSTDEKVWSLCSNSNKDIIFTTPIPKDAYVAPRMIRIKSGNSYNRAVYYDDSVKLEANTTYRLSMDYKPLSGSPAFGLAFRNKNYKPASGQSDHQNIKNHSIGYKDWYDDTTSIRYIEFTTLDDVSYLGGIEITIGNTGEAQDISCIFANPQFTKIVDGEVVGDNLINGITDETVQHMGSMSYNGTWNLRYQGSKNGALVVEPIPENYFRIPVFVTNDSVGSLTQFVTVNAGKNYVLSFDYKDEGGSECIPYIEAFSDSKSLGQIKYSEVTKDTDGYYNYKCEFKVPKNLRKENNLRIGVKLDGVIAAISNFSLYELDSGFEKIGVNLLNNSDFSKTKKIPEYDGTATNEWVFEGTTNNSGVAYRGNTYFKIPVEQLYIFAGGSNGNYIYREMELIKDKKYTLSFNLRYANPGYDGDTGVELLYHNGTEWTALDAEFTESDKEYKHTYKFTMPSDSAQSTNMRFKIKAGSLYVSGYLANAVLKLEDSSENLLVNGDFANGTSDWKLSGSFKFTSLNAIPKNYFSKTEDTNHMVVYRNSASWENIMQNYLNLKSDCYYLLKGESVHPWQPNETSVYALQVFGTKDGKDYAPFLGNTAEKIPASTPNTIYYLYKTPENLNSNGNAYFRMVMQGVGNAGYWGSMALYESNEKGEILSDNVLINSDFALGTTCWTFSQRDEDFNYRIVEQPDGFFENYSKNGPNMIESTGDNADALLGQTITVERGKKYFFTGHYVSMNSAGITPKVIYKDKNGKEQEYTINSYYDSERFFFEIAFELPSEAFANRGVADVKFVLDNGTNGKAYISDLALYEDGKYTNLFGNNDFSNDFKKWDSDANYKILPFDSGVFVFHYDDEKFNDGNWANEDDSDMILIKGQVMGYVLDDWGNTVSDVEMLLKPGNHSAKTDENGQYLFKDMKSGTYTLYLKDKNGKEHHITEIEVRDGICSNVSLLTLTLKQDESNYEDNYEDNNSSQIIPDDTTSEETSSEQAPSEETSSEQAPSEETPSEETSSEATPSEETPSEETSSEETPSEETPSEETSSEETSSDEVSSEETISDITSSNNDVIDNNFNNDLVVDNQDVLDDFNNTDIIVDNNDVITDNVIDGSNVEVENVQIDMNYGIVCGYLLDANGNPLKNMKLYIGKVGEVVTKAKGVFQFDKVRPGRYDVYTKNEDGTINVLKTVEVVAGKGSMYKLYLPSESSNLLLIIIITVSSVVVLAGVGFTVWFILKKKKAKLV